MPAGDGRVWVPPRSLSQETWDYGAYTPTSSPVSRHSGYWGDEDGSQQECNYSRLRSPSRLVAMQQPAGETQPSEEVDDAGPRDGLEPSGREKEGVLGQAVVGEASNGEAGGGWAIVGSETKEKESVTEDEESVTEDEEEEPAINEG